MMKIKRSCPNCCHLFQLKSISEEKSNYIPLFLSCGHSICDLCVTNIVKFEEPMVCKVCKHDMAISNADRALLQQKKITLYKLFPINTLLLGEITAQMLKESTEDPKKPEDDFYIDLRSIIKSTNNNSRAQCLECHQMTTKICLQCKRVICHNCFSKSHENFAMFKDHVLANIDLAKAYNCMTHTSKVLDAYCKDCSKAICMACLMVGEKSCKNHNYVPLEEVNVEIMQDLTRISPKVNETFKRLAKTAVDVGRLLHNMENESCLSPELIELLDTVEYTISKLMSAIQKPKCSEIESLRKTRVDLIENITRVSMVIKNINATADPLKTEQMNLAVILNAAKEVVDTPWYLTKDETKDPLTVTVNADLCSVVDKYMRLLEKASSEYELLSYSELGPNLKIPPALRSLVVPPGIPKSKIGVPETLSGPSPVPKLRQPFLTAAK